MEIVLRTRHRVVALLTVVVLSSGSSRAVAAQPPFPSTGENLARAPRPTWLAALAAACDTLPVDTTWRRVNVPESDATLPVPLAMLEQAQIFGYYGDDEIPSVPRRGVELYQYDSALAHVTREIATVVIRCSDHLTSRSVARPKIWIMGYDSRRVGATPRGVWYVLASWGRRDLWLFGMSRDLSGARALVTAISRLAVPADSADDP